MAAFVAVERHLWLHFFNTKENDKMFLMDPPFSPPAFGDAMNLVIERFHEAKKQAKAFKRYLPH